MEMLMCPKEYQGWEQRSQKKSKKIVRTEDKNHWREQEKREREQNTSGKIAAGKESCYLLPALHFLAAWESNARRDAYTILFPVWAPLESM